MTTEELQAKIDERINKINDLEKEIGELFKGGNLEKCSFSIVYQFEDGHQHTHTNTVYHVNKVLKVKGIRHD